jgi:hypothetical protein
MCGPSSKLRMTAQRALVVRFVNKKADNFVTSGNGMLISEVVKYLNRSEVILCKTSAN